MKILEGIRTTRAASIEVIQGQALIVRGIDAIASRERTCWRRVYG